MEIYCYKDVMENEYVAICSNSYEKVKEFKSVAIQISQDPGLAPA